MLREYPVEKATSAPATGRLVYEHLMRTIRVPAAASHTIWYNGEKAKLDNPEKYAFRGDIPVGTSGLILSLSGKPIVEASNAVKQGNDSFFYTFLGTEGPVLVSDLSEEWKETLGIPKNAGQRDKVFNPNFRPYDELNEATKFSNELAALSLPKSISSYFGSKKNINYSERDVLNMLTSAVSNLSGPKMAHILHGNHMAWAALDYMRSTGNVNGDLMNEFYGQQPADFYMKDLGTVLPSIFYASALLGTDPVDLFKKIDIDIWGARDVALYMRQFMRNPPANLF